MSSKRKANKKLEETSPVQEIVESLKDDVVDNLDFSSETKAPFEEEKVPSTTAVKRSGSKFKLGGETEDQKLYRPEFVGSG